MALAIILLLVGLALVVAEVFFVSMGLLSAMAAACIITADIIAFRQSTTAGWVLVAIEVVMVPLLIWGAFRVLPHLPFGRRMLLTGPVTPKTGGLPDLTYLLGREGDALTDLRPSGTVAFDDERVSVVAVGGLLTQGSRVLVVAVEGAEVRVRAVSSPESPSSPHS